MQNHALHRVNSAGAGTVLARVLRQFRQQPAVSGRETQSPEFVAAHPAKGWPGIFPAVQWPASKEMKVHAAVRVLMLVIQYRSEDFDPQTRLFPALADGGRRAGFAGLDFATGKLPISAQDRAGLAGPDQKAIVLLDHGDRDADWGVHGLADRIKSSNRPGDPMAW
jgi:hypothetical protein